MNIQRAETDLFTDDINILLKDENGNILNWKLNRILKVLTSQVSCTCFSDKYLKKKKKLFLLGRIKVLLNLRLEMMVQVLNINMKKRYWFTSDSVFEMEYFIQNFKF